MTVPTIRFVDTRIRFWHMDFRREMTPRGRRVPRAGEECKMSDTKITLSIDGPQAFGRGARAGQREARREASGLHRHACTASAAIRAPSNVLEPCAMFEKLGYVTLRFDMPGCGESEGERGNLICLEQVQAASDGLTFLAQASERRRRPHRPDRLELWRRGRGLHHRRRQARGGVDLVRRLGRRRDANSAASIRRRRPGRSSPTCWRRESSHREKTGKSLMVPRYDIVPIPEHLRGHLAGNSIQMFTAETAQSMYDFRADDVIGKASGRPILLLHSSVDLGDADRAVDRDVQARQPAVRSASRSPRPITSCSPRATPACAL